MTENRVENHQERLSVFIFRLEKTEKYFKVANSVFEDARLSWEARGLMGYLLSKPHNWRVRPFDLVARGPAGVHKMHRMLRELEAAGYLYRTRLRRNDGTFGWIFMVLEHPSLAEAPGARLPFRNSNRRSVHIWFIHLWFSHRWMNRAWASARCTKY